MSERKKMVRRLHGRLFKLPGMITCEEFESFVLAYLEDDLPTRQKVVFELHLKICRECRDYLAAYRASMELTSSALKAGQNETLENVPDDLVKAILDARSN